MKVARAIIPAVHVRRSDSLKPDDYSILLITDDDGSNMMACEAKCLDK